ncbi:hypothetical protein FQV39_28725 [Bosea sp. F3-2]|uniref:hypothetical protein n=1 Tax=Bosea sp. F3-2 TaxID=2599640 RepID=UPI0011EC7D3C|nr:hypothetical protein [Bosea sp. F3-2]QEL26149.1 hypothetical protein FQV39_28725 [Bosea sp. F3-2]
MVLDTAGVLFGDTATIFPMTTGGGVNGKPEADASRESMTGVTVIRSEWSERVQIGGNGLPTPPGAFKVAAAGFRVVATLQPAGLQWVPRKGDEIVFDDRLSIRYRISEPMPDGLSGLHLGLTRISG